MASLADLVKWRDALVEARLSGVRELQDQNGESVRYGTDSELARAIAAADREIAAMGRRTSNAFTFKTSKGLDHA
ncbi:hypothetical protein JOD31_001513 [Methylopila capsulata]|uniref:Uncharacterized protein n=1 Tax=Methylopila capsulata TaxID=61654 RepID=A0A9W6IQ09_9HYPH|nr:hypothetical protein [Methylopila capsulata]MBM7851288.1 hypothetical protein [Methylopila capsulata]GLK54346.1 hypothetical protein GCM10008170_03650 [Methylopila capsulata]